MEGGGEAVRHFGFWTILAVTTDGDVVRFELRARAIMFASDRRGASATFGDLAFCGAGHQGARVA